MVTKTVEYNPALGRAVLTLEASEEYDLARVGDSDEGLRIVQSSARPDVILLDLTNAASWGACGGNGANSAGGFEECARIRAADPRVVILAFVTADEGGEAVRALDSGADDYVTHPIENEELFARLRAVFRGRGWQAGGRNVVEIGDLYIDVANHIVRVKGEEVQIRNQEIYLLSMLAETPGRLMTRQQMARRMHGPDWNGGPGRVVDVNISRLRKRFDDLSDYRYIHTVPRKGYRFEPVPKADLPEDKRRSAQQENARQRSARRRGAKDTS